METIAQEAKRLLESVPEECIIGGDFDYENEPINGRKTSFTWLKDGGLDVKRYADASYKFLRSKGFGATFHWDVSDGKIDSYRHPTRKQREVALLDDMIEAGY
jgi:hypothetical protein